MNVKIYPQESKSWVVQKQLLSDFGKVFGFIKVKTLEPHCPFCGKTLQQAKCNCFSFLQALNMFLAKFNQEKIDVKLDGKMFDVLYPLSQASVQTIIATEENLLYCESGTIAKSDDIFSKHDFWFVSSGVINQNILTFYVRKKGSNQIFEYKLFDIDLIDLPLQKVYVVKTKTNIVSHGSRRLGDYHIEHQNNVLAKLSYDDFLQQLKDCLKD